MPAPAGSVAWLVCLVGAVAALLSGGIQGRLLALCLVLCGVGSRYRLPAAMRRAARGSGHGLILLGGVVTGIGGSLVIFSLFADRLGLVPHDCRADAILLLYPGGLSLSRSVGGAFVLAGALVAWFLGGERLDPKLVFIALLSGTGAGLVLGLLLGLFYTAQLRQGAAC